MNTKQTLMSLSRKIRNMKSYKVFGTPEMPMKIRLNIWKTYFYSKLLYPIFTLRLLDKTSLARVISKISMSLKDCLRLNRKLSQNILFGWIQELTPKQRADLCILRIIKKLNRINLPVRNELYFLEKTESITSDTRNKYLNGETSIKQIKLLLEKQRDTNTGIKHGKPFCYLDEFSSEWLRLVTGDLDIYRWKDAMCSCGSNLNIEHLTVCDQLKEKRNVIESLTENEFSEILKDPSTLNKCASRENLRKPVTKRIAEMIQIVNSKNNSREPVFLSLVHSF